MLYVRLNRSRVGTAHMYCWYCWFQIEIYTLESMMSIICYRKKSRLRALSKSYRNF
jgi:hypothetical protein